MTTPMNELDKHIHQVWKHTCANLKTQHSGVLYGLIQPDGEMMNSYSILVAFTVVFLQSQSVCTSCSNFYLSTDFICFIDFIVG